jgi:hypothetical protein
MNDRQIKNLWLGVLALVAIGIYPPWKEYGATEAPLNFAPLFDPPKLLESQVSRGIKKVDIDFSRLGIEIFLGCLVTGALVAGASSAGKSGGTAGSLSGGAAGAKSGGAASGAPLKGTAQAQSVPKSTANGLVVQLPKDYLLGTVLVESKDDPEYWEEFGPARGTIVLPEGVRLQLEVAKDVRVDMGLLSRFPSGSLYSLDLSECKLTDDDVTIVSKLSGLKELDLSSTPVSGEGVKTLKSLNTLEKLWLDHTLVDDSCVPALISLSNLKKLSLEGTNLNELSIENLKKDLPAAELVV